ncbi:phage tail assembly chaperone [Emcibacter nanhaiensis]|uniref:Phage tail assembly chaperone n=1 Tax=Emcibacter nanhaiensis TaxID=1505037 RepID=A0A501PCJ4_9PROT|nr:phage tail assembly chaperone [Emcibacter nanhaiensis]TPD57742.1 phage tail assembly chaperone [Emcibacter nanhaiensis]
MTGAADGRIIPVWAMLAFGLLGWMPSEFLKVTPWDLALVLQARQKYFDYQAAGDRPLDRTGLTGLMEKLGSSH